MARIVIVSASDKNRNALSQLLVSSGLPVFRCCASGSELRRTMDVCEDGVVILMGSLSDCTPEELQWDYGDRIQMLWIGKPALLDSCEAKEIFHLPLPASSQAIVGAVEMLNQLHHMQLPKRGGTEKEKVEQARKQLMESQGLTEAQAHRALQQYAMNHGMKMADAADVFIRTSKGMER